MIEQATLPCGRAKVRQLGREGKMCSRAAGYVGLAMLEGALKRQFEMAEVTA